MRNKLKSNSTNNNTYFDLEIISKFESLEEYPNTKPILLAHKNGEILYTNEPLELKYDLKKGDCLFDLNCEPSFHKIFEKLSTHNSPSFCVDVLCEKEDDYFEPYLINIEKVELNEEELYLVYIDSEDNRKRITKKINTYNHAIESVSVGVLIADDKANVQYISTSFEEFFNVKIEDIFNQNLVYTFNKYLSEFEINELDIAVINQKPWVKVISDINNDGDVKYKEIRLNVVEDKSDNTVNYIITANDITKHVQQARLIKKSEQRQKSIINNISDPILILRKENGDLIFDNANNNFYKEILGKDESHEGFLLEVVAPVLHSIIHEAIVILEDSNRLHAPFHYTSPITNNRFLGKVTFTDDQYDNTRIFIVNMTDITEQLEIERKLRDAYKKEISLNKLKSTFLANMSHEIRTPLNAIVGYSDLLEDDVKEMNYESSAKMTTYLKDGVNRLLKLVDNIVEVSLLESGNEDINLDNIALNNIISSNKENWIEEAKLRAIEFYFSLDLSNPVIEANEEKLERAIKEIVDNAIKYNNDGGSVYVSTYEEDGNIILQVSDTGIGIEQESLQKIFQLFEQVDEEGYTRKYEGAGLGLSLANKLVSFMNGKMHIISQPNEGTIISISFPKS